MLSKTEFQTLLGEATGAWSVRDFDRALARLEKILTEGGDEMRAEALFFRGMIAESAGDQKLAREDWLNALHLASEGTFLQFSLQLHVGKTYENEGSAEALTWYRNALQTCSEGEEFSGHKALSATLALMRGRFALEDSEVISRVVDKSWRVLGLSEKPDLKNLEASTNRLDEHFTHLSETILADESNGD